MCILRTSTDCAVRVLIGGADVRSTTGACRSVLLIKNSVYVGFITLLLGFIVEKLLVFGNKNDNFLTNIKNKNYINFYISLFLFGCMIHLISDAIGLEAYCEKKCIDDVCNYYCHIGFSKKA